MMEQKMGRKNKTTVISEQIYGKVPPQAKNLEVAILGALMIDANCVYVAMSKLFPEIFYVEAHQRIFKAIQSIYDKNEKIDILTVVEQLKKTDELDAVGGIYNVTKLTNDVINGANIEFHIALISELYMKREAIRLSGELISDAYEDTTDAFDVINKADNGFSKIQERIISGTNRDIAYFADKVLEQHAQVKSTGVLGIPTKIKCIDTVISGLVSPDLIILAARPGQGKTAFALTITHNVSVKEKIPCAWFSLEMDGIQLVRRLASMDGDIEHEKIRKAYTTRQEELRLGESIERIQSSPIYIEDKATLNTRDIRTRAHLLKKKHGIQFIVIDYIQLMNGIDVKNKTREQVVSDISRSLKMIAKEIEIPIIALSQLSRAVEQRPDKMPQLSDLRESGGIEQDADEVIFLMRPEYYHMTNSVQIGTKEYDPAGLTIVSIAKNRHGGTKNLALEFNAPFMKFKDHHLDEADFFTNNNLSINEDTPF